jgi:hypothetical protein
MCSRQDSKDRHRVGREKIITFKSGGGCDTHYQGREDGHKCGHDGN